MNKDQIQQISEQIRKQTSKIGKVKPRYTKYISPPGNIIPSDNQERFNVMWSKWWFVPEEAPYTNIIGQSEFNNWLEANSDIHFSTLTTNGDGLFDGPVSKNAHLYYSIEVKTTVPKLLRITLDSAYGINILVNNISILSNIRSGKYSQVANIPGGDVWIPIEIYAFNPYENDSALNKINIYMDLVGTFGYSNIRSQVPLAPNNLSASNGFYTNRIELIWDINGKITDQDKVQIWKSSDGIIWSSLGSVDGNITSYSDRDVNESDRFFYKIRYITREGGISAFSSVVTGIAGSTNASIEISLSKNSAINDDASVGNYQLNDIITATIRSRSPLFEDSIMVDLEYPTTSGLGYYRVPVASGVGNYIGSETWETSIDLSSAAASGYPIADGRAKIIAKGYVPGIAPDGWMGPAGTAGTVAGIKGFNIDNKAPLLSFFIDYDRQFTTEDTITYSNNVALLIDNLIDLKTDAKEYHNPDDDEKEPEYINGEKYVSDIYQLRWANTEETLTGLDEGGNNLTEWKNFFSIGLIIDPHYLDMTGGNTKYVFMQARDMAGNSSLIASDSILYVTGLGTVQNLAITSHYEYLDLKWDSLTGYSTIDGYYIYRNITGTTPSIGASPYAIIGPSYGSENITGFQDIYPNAAAGIDYNYWAKAYIGDGTSPENHILSAEYSSKATSGLRTDPPSVDIVVTGEGNRESIHIKWQVPIGDDDEQTATEHVIYRCDESYDPPIIASSELVQTFGIVGTGEYFDLYDASAPLGLSYRYTSVSRNGPWLDDTTYYSNTDDIEWTELLSIADEPPYAPTWADDLCYTGPWGAKLSWNNNRTLYPTHDDDVQGYTLFMSIGAGSSFANASGIAHVSCPDLGSEYVHFVVNGSLMSRDTCKFWLVAYDLRQSGELSDVLTTGLTPVYPNDPVWVSGESYAHYGYNHLVWLGGGDDYGFQAGYNIYRAIRDPQNPPLNNGLEYATGTYGATLIGTIEDTRSDPGYKIDLNDIIPASGWGIEYCYWVSAINTYGYESDAPLLTGLGYTQPNFDGFFDNYFDNGSLERSFQYGTWQINEAHTYIVTGYGGDGGYEANTPHGDKHLFLRSYSGYSASSFQYDYIFVQGGLNYCCSYHAYKPESWLASFRTTVDWYSISGTLISTDTWNINGGTYNQTTLIDNDTWRKMHYFFAAPSTATYATVKFGFATEATTERIHLDEFQWEVSGAGSPGQFVDSRNISADKMMAHSITADMIMAGSISASHIQAETISSYHIRASGITLDRLEVIPSMPLTRFVLDSHSNDLHDIEIVTTGGLPYISNDQGVNWYPVVFVDIGSLPAGWSRTSDYFITGPDDSSEYYLYLDSWPTSPGGTASIYVSSADTYPASAAQILARLENHLNSEQNGGLFEIHEWNGPGVQINGNNIVAGTIHGKYIEAETISGENIAGNSISADKLEVGVLPTIADTNFKFVSITTPYPGFAILGHDGGQPKARLHGGNWVNAKFVDPGSNWLTGSYSGFTANALLMTAAGSENDTYYLFTDSTTSDDPILISSHNTPSSSDLGDHGAYIAKAVYHTATNNFDIRPPMGDIYISSGMIMASSIGADHIVSDSIRADHLQVGAAPTFLDTNFKLVTSGTSDGIVLQIISISGGSPLARINDYTWKEVSFYTPSARWSNYTTTTTNDTLRLNTAFINSNDIYYIGSNSLLSDAGIVLEVSQSPNILPVFTTSYFAKIGVHKPANTTYPSWKFTIETPNSSTFVGSGNILAHSITSQHIYAQTINSNEVKVVTTSGDVYLDYRGITVSGSENEYTRITAADIRHADSHYHNTFYDNKTITIPAVAPYKVNWMTNSFSLGKWFDQGSASLQTIANLQPGLSRTDTSVMTWASRGGLVYCGAGPELYGAFSVPSYIVVGRYFMSTMWGNYTVIKQLYTTGTDYHDQGSGRRTWMPLAYGDYSYYTYDQPTDVDTMFITHYGKDEYPYTSGLCWSAAFRIMIHGGVNGLKNFTFKWMTGAFYKTGSSNYQFGDRYQGSKTINLEPDETFIWDTPIHMVTPGFDFTYLDDTLMKWKRARGTTDYKMGLQLRLWTTDTIQSPAGSGLLMESLDPIYAPSALMPVVFYQTTVSGTNIPVDYGDEYYAIPYTGNITVKSV